MMFLIPNILMCLLTYEIKDETCVIYLFIYLFIYVSVGLWRIMDTVCIDAQ